MVKTHGWYPLLLLSPPHVIVSVNDSLPAATSPTGRSSRERAYMSNFNMVKAIQNQISRCVYTKITCCRTKECDV